MMDTLCGNESFWDLNKTWKGDWPEFSPCFQSLVLTCGPCLILWAWTLFYLPWLLLRERASQTFIREWLFWTKQVSGTALLVLSLLSVFSAVSDVRRSHGTDSSIAQLIAACSRTISMVLVLTMVVIERQRGCTKSTCLFLFWLIVVVCDVVPLYTYILRQDQSDGDKLVKMAVFYSTFILELMQLSLHSLSLQTPSYSQDQCPETGASFPSWLTYFWMNRLMSRGYRDELNKDDVFQLASRDQMLNAGEQLNRSLIFREQRSGCSVESTKAETRTQSYNPSSKEAPRTVVSDEKTPLLCSAENTRYHSLLSSARLAKKKKDRLSSRLPPQQTSGEQKRIVCGRKLVLGKSLLRTFFWSTVASNVWKLPHDLLLLANPLLLGQLIRLCDDVTVPEWKGYVIGVALCTSLLLQSLLFQLTFHLSMTLGLRVKSALTAAIFKKILTVASKGRRESPEGEIINLISVDTQHITVFLSFLSYAWSGPVQLALAVYCLYRTIGMAVFAGTVFLMLLLPLNGWLMSKLGALQTTLMEHKDTRIKMVTEILSAIKTVKVYAWESILGSRVSRAREAELGVLQKVALMDASQTVAWTLAPFCMALLTFITHIYTDEEGALTSEEVFVTLSYLNVMRGVVTVAPMVITDLVKAAVSMKRLDRFLNHEDLDPSNLIKDSEQEAAVVIRNATCSWERDTEPCLKGISLEIEEGSLVAVVGSMGSGKSSLLAALLGELHLHSGSVTVKCAGSYVPQQAWLRHSTVRGNILAWDQELDSARYSATLRACALTSDLDAMPASDLTEVGEKGLSVSGGQRQRISLARAVYESRDLYLLDDPISAVDNRVGRQIFSDLIGQKGLLRDATRIVATSTYHWLPQADVILVMAGGEVVEMGDYGQLMAHEGHLARLVAADREQGTKRANLEVAALYGYQVSDCLKANSDQQKCVHKAVQEQKIEEDLCQEESQKQETVLIEVSSDRPSPTADLLYDLDEEKDNNPNLIRLEDETALHFSSPDTLSICTMDTAMHPSTKILNSELVFEDRDDGNDSEKEDLTLSTTLTNQTNQEGPLMRTLVEHSEDKLLSVSDASRSYHRSWASMMSRSLRTRRGREALTSTSCDLLGKGENKDSLEDEEVVHAGKVKWQVYIAIARALGIAFLSVMMACYVLYHACAVSANYWLSYWTDTTSLNHTEDHVAHSHNFYLAVYGSLGTGQLLFVLVFALLLAFRRVKASNSLHTSLLRSVLFSPLQFFQTNPAARVLNRMSRDLEVLDIDLWFAVEVVLDSLCYVISTCVVVCISSPFYLLGLLPVSAVYYYLQRYYISTSRQLRRLESKSRSPVFAQLSHMLNGCVVLRASGNQATEHAYQTAAGLVDSNLRFSFTSNTATRWLGVRVAAIGVLIVGVATIVGVSLRDSISGGLVGLTITYALDVTENLNWLVRMLGDLETNAVSVERILEYSDLTPEHEEKFPTMVPCQEWPTFGCIQFVNLSASYTSDSTPVLKHINCTIQPAEKMGVVGRTGAGKTSLWGVLLGLITSTDGAVLIDDVDIRCVPLHELRKRIAVMPQEPLILEGTIRMNLDPEGQTSEESMWAVLEQTQMANHVRGLTGGLDYHCQTDGQGLSAGQKQLLCLARILLRHCRVIVLDEATSSVDMETDDVICQTIQRACADCTVIIVSHRLSTVRHCDRVMVLDQGRLVEVDRPSRLLADPYSHFSRLAASCNMTR